METLNLICFNCAHWDNIEGCKAFPNGIPDTILLTNIHDKPLPGQGNNLVFKTKQNDTNRSTE